MSCSVTNIAGPSMPLRRLIMPQPYKASMPGAPRSVAVVLSSVEIWSPLMYGKRSICSAALPATWGAAMDVPLSVAVAVVPEGLPAVVTITLALGAQRMLRRNALIRRPCGLTWEQSKTGRSPG